MRPVVDVAQCAHHLHLAVYNAYVTMQHIAVWQRDMEDNIMPGMREGHQRSQDFCLGGGGAPGRDSTQPCISRAHVTNKISKTVSILNKLRSFLPSGVLQTIYNTLILPHMIYGILAWGRHTKVIHKIQKRAIRIIAASKYNAHTEPLFKQLNLLKACDICKLQELKFYHKLINIHLPK